jgi:hypothetical protein
MNKRQWPRAEHLDVNSIERHKTVNFVYSWLKTFYRLLASEDVYLSINQYGTVERIIKEMYDIESGSSFDYTQNGIINKKDEHRRRCRRILQEFEDEMFYRYGTHEIGDIINIVPELTNEIDQLNKFVKSINILLEVWLLANDKGCLLDLKASRLNTLYAEWNSNWLNNTSLLLSQLHFDEIYKMNRELLLSTSVQMFDDLADNSRSLVINIEPVLYRTYSEYANIIFAQYEALMHPEIASLQYSRGVPDSNQIEKYYDLVKEDLIKYTGKSWRIVKAHKHLISINRDAKVINLPKKGQKFASNRIFFGSLVIDIYLEILCGYQPSDNSIGGNLSKLMVKHLISSFLDHKTYLELSKHPNIDIFSILMKAGVTPMAIADLAIKWGKEKHVATALKGAIYDSDTGIFAYPNLEQYNIQASLLLRELIIMTRINNPTGNIAKDIFSKIAFSNVDVLDVNSVSLIVNRPNIKYTDSQLYEFVTKLKSRLGIFYKEQNFDIA